MRSPASGGPPAWGRRAGKRSRQKGRGNISELGKRVNQWGLKQGLIANFVAVWAWHRASVHVTTVVNRVWNSSGDLLMAWSGWHFWNYGHPFS